MKPDFRKVKSVKKGGKDAVASGLVLWAGTAITAATGVPPFVTVPAVAGVFGVVRNILKQKIPRFFGWL